MGRSGGACVTPDSLGKKRGNYGLTRIRLGASGESIAARFLEDSGLKVIDRDWRCRLGQLDLVCLDGDVVVAVEVKTRRGLGFGPPAAAVDWRKQAKLISLLETYRSLHHVRHLGCRIDVVALLVGRNDEILECEHIRNAVQG